MVGAAEKSLEDTNGHNADNNYSWNHIPGSLTAHKEKTLATPEAVFNTRQLEDDKAKAHLDEMRNENGCRVPQRRCVPVGNDPSKMYIPHCTSIYVCAADSGCCPAHSDICAPKHIQKIEKRVRVRINMARRSHVETLTFENHTECHCIDRRDFHAEGAQLASRAVLPHATVVGCTCPRFFERILQDDGQCRCDCTSGNTDCEFLKRGIEHFSIDERKRIQQGLCKIPTCQYGDYIKRQGGCPKPLEHMGQRQGSYKASLAHS